MIGRIVVAGGGTGGHLYPGIAVVEELRRRNPDVDVRFVGSPRGIEARVLPKMGERVELMDVRPLMGRSPSELTRNLLRLPGSLGKAAAWLRRQRPDLVLGVGGYASGPMLAAAAALRIPTALLEQNAHVGLTNRVLSRTVGRAYLSFPETAALFGEERARVVGNPVRRAFVDAAHAAMSDPDGFEARARHVLVLGGSQGARVLNEVVPRALSMAELSRRGLRVLHQTGAPMLDAVRERYAQLGVEAEVQPFIEDMAKAYANAGIVIARAGATTVAELCAIGRPAVLVPYPHAADDHQAKNAYALERQGAAVAIPDHELAAGMLADELNGLLDAPARRRRMADAARAHGRPDAAAAVVDDLLAWLGRAAGTPSQGSPAGGGSLDEPSEEPSLKLVHAAATQARARGVRRHPKVRRCELRIDRVDEAVGAAH